MKKLFFIFSLFTLLLSSCGGVIPYPHINETQTPQPPSLFSDLEPITEENINRLEQVNQLGDGNIFGIAVSPDKQTFAVHATQGIYLYELPSLKQKQFIPQPAPVSALPTQHFPLSFTPDGKRLAISYGWIIYFYDLETHKYTQQLVVSEIPDWNISEIAFSPDGNRTLIITTGGARACDGGGINYALYDFNSTLLFDKYFCTEEAKSYFRFTQDGKLYLFYASIMTYDFPIELYAVEIDKGKLIESSIYNYGSMQYDPEKFYYDVSFDGKTLATARHIDNKYQTIIMDALTRKELSRVDGLIRFVQSPNGQTGWKPLEARFTQLEENYFLIYKKCGDLTSFDQTLEIEENKFVVQQDSLVYVLNLSTCKVESSFHFYSSGMDSLISPNGKFLVTTGDDGTFLWDISTGKIVLELIGSPLKWSDVENVFSFDKTGSLLLTGKRGYKNSYPDQPNRKYIISIWDIQARKKVEELAPDTEFPDRIIPTVDENVVMAEDTAGLNFWDIHTGKLLSTLPPGKYVFSPDGNSIWVSVIKQEANSAQGTKDIQVLTQYDYRTGKVLREFSPYGNPVKGLYLNDVGTKMAIHFWAERTGKTAEDVLKVIDLASNEMLWELRWDITTEPFVRTPKTDDHEDYGFSKEFYLSQYGSMFAKYGFPMYTDLWNFQSDKPYSVIPRGQMLGSSGIIVTTNTQLPYSYNKEVIQFWSSKTGNLLGEITTRYRISTIAFIPLGYLIVTSGDDGIIHLWGIKRIDR